MADPISEESLLENYDVVQLTLNCISGANRKMMVDAEKLKKILEKEDGSVYFDFGPVSDSPLLYDRVSSAGSARVDCLSSYPIPWLSTTDLRVGGAMCHISPPSANQNAIFSPRKAAAEHCHRLSKEFGLKIQSAIEAEFMVFEKDEVTNFNEVEYPPYARYDSMAGRDHIMLDTCQSLVQAQLPLESFMLELAPSQFELTFKPVEATRCPDAIITMKDGLRTMLGQNAMVPTFMTSPTSGEHANGFHFNHSLWRCAAENENALLDVRDDLLLSDTAKHWIAGLIHHGPALTALFCPTVNCYRRLEDEVVPQTFSWGIENRTAFLRVKNDKKNVYIENRLPSSACNPYLAMAGTIAAGMDGLKRKLECPPQNCPTAAKTPSTMEEAIALLEKDTILVDSIGKELISAFCDLFKKGMEARDAGRLRELDQQRFLYFHTI